MVRLTRASLTLQAVVALFIWLGGGSALAQKVGAVPSNLPQLPRVVELHPGQVHLLAGGPPVLATVRGYSLGRLPGAQAAVNGAPQAGIGVELSQTTSTPQAPPGQLVFEYREVRLRAAPDARSGRYDLKLGSGAQASTLPGVIFVSRLTLQQTASLDQIADMLVQGRTRGEVEKYWRQVLDTNPQMDAIAAIPYVIANTGKKLEASIAMLSSRIRASTTVNTDLSNALQRQQQTLQSLSSIQKVLSDTAMATSRKVGG